MVKCTFSGGKKKKKKKEKKEKTVFPVIVFYHDTPIRENYSVMQVLFYVYPYLTAVFCLKTKYNIYQYLLLKIGIQHVHVRFSLSFPRSEALDRLTLSLVMFNPKLCPTLFTFLFLSRIFFAVFGCCQMDIIFFFDSVTVLLTHTPGMLYKLI